VNMTSRVLMLIPVVGLSGCPVGPPETGGDAAAELPNLKAVAGTTAEQGGDALNALVQQAERDRFPPAPTVATLCKLNAGHTNYNDAKKIMAVKPQGESQDAMMAGLSYRFRPANAEAAGAAGSAGAAGAGGNPDDAEPITLFLTFAWSDGDVGLGTKLFGIGGSPEDFLTGYILDKMSISGMPYPECWPHEED
jgi:hypothetical protein